MILTRILMIEALGRRHDGLRVPENQNHNGAKILLVSTSDFLISVLFAGSNLTLRTFLNGIFYGESIFDVKNWF